MYLKITQPPEGLEKNRWLDVTNELHHKMKVISSSKLKFFKSYKENEQGKQTDGPSPLSFYEKYVLGNVKFESNDNFRIGTLAHLAVLEPEKFESSVIVCELDQRTTEFKEYLKSLVQPIPKNDLIINNQEEIKKLLNEWGSELEIADSKEQTKVIKEKIKRAKKDLKESQDFLDIQLKSVEVQFTKDGGFIDSNGLEKFLVKPSEMVMYRAYQTQFEKHGRLSYLMSDVIIEQSGIAQDPKTDLWMSLRGDARSTRGFFVDPKTTADDLSSESISKYCNNFGLALQEAHYMECANLIDGPDSYKKFFFVFMSKNPPYEIALIQLDREAKIWGFKKRRQILDLIARCQDSGRWPSIDTDPKTQDRGLIISLPSWGLKW